MRVLKNCAGQNLNEVVESETLIKIYFITGQKTQLNLTQNSGHMHCRRKNNKHFSLYSSYTKVEGTIRIVETVDDMTGLIYLICLLFITT